MTSGQPNHSHIALTHSHFVPGGLMDNFLTAFYDNLISFATSLQNADPYAISFIFALLIIAASIVVTVNIPVREARIVFVVFFAFLTFILAQGFGDKNHDFFFNLSTEFIGAAVGLLLFAELLLNEVGGLMMLFGVSLIVLFAPVIVQTLDVELFTDEFVLNLRTDLLGAFIVAVLLNRGWVIYDKLKKASETNLTLKEKEELLSTTSAELAQRSRELVQAERTLNRETKTLQRRSAKVSRIQQILGQQRDQTMNYPEVSKARQAIILVEGSEIDPVVKTLDQIFTVRNQMKETFVEGKSQRSIQYVCCTVETPDRTFAEQLRERFDALIQDWQQQAQHTQEAGDFAEQNDPQTMDYRYGKAAGYQLAIEDLQTLIKQMSGD
jgi:hypothetical protein